MQSVTNAGADAINGVRADLIISRLLGMKPAILNDNTAAIHWQVNLSQRVGYRILLGGTKLKFSSNRNIYSGRRPEGRMLMLLYDEEPHGVFHFKEYLDSEQDRIKTFTTFSELNLKVGTYNHDLHLTNLRKNLECCS